MKFLNKKEVMLLLDKILEHRLFGSISVSIIISFILFNSFSYFKNFLDKIEEEKLKKQEKIFIKINIPEDNSLFGISEQQIEYQVKDKDTMSKILSNLGVSENDTLNILNALKKVYNPALLHSGQRISIKYSFRLSYQKINELGSLNKNSTVNSIVIITDLDKKVIIKRQADGSYQANEVKINLNKQIIKYSGVINNGLFVDGTGGGLPPNIMMNMIGLLSYDVDFQRDIKKGDKFEVLFESFYDDNGQKLKDGHILYAALALQKRRLDIYRYKASNNDIEYFDAIGNSIKKSLLRTPINGARISSRFGMRKHPVLGYSRMHKGLDFAAPTGTPILAAGSGTITYYGRRAGYGNYVRISHNKEYSTAYGHASRFVKNLRMGSKVKQGQVVAYVGSTGLASGPHLHYEILFKGQQINPSLVKVASGLKLSGKELVKFKAVKNEIEHYRHNIANQNQKITLSEAG